ncbi:MAG: hypothetical protein COS90_05175 [Deltaproteobacteria bacterium CG07_land_8_20_14_0_80_60_11]|nr:MAG: hypothetical protein COS90_05175 [Deltaproteobacteria bacterium CG07_land_8_20_14_0_80_60_11]
MKALSRCLAPLKPGRGVLLWGGRLRTRAAANRHFGRLLAPVMDYFVEVGSREGRCDATRRATPAVAALPPGQLWGGSDHPASSRPQKGDL